VGLKLIFLIVTRAVSLLGLSRREWWWKNLAAVSDGPGVFGVELDGAAEVGEGLAVLPGQVMAVSARAR
jgi:hypothetical protein